MNPDTVLTDIRCRCGGLCDSREPCPMRGNVEACRCGSIAAIHAGTATCRTVPNPWMASAAKATARLWCGTHGQRHDRCDGRS